MRSIIIIALFILLVGCAQTEVQTGAEAVEEKDQAEVRAGQSHDGPLKEISELPAVEVREYEGERLDSVKSFRDNSIKGTQKIDTSTYLLKVDGLVGSPRDYTYEEVLEHDAYKKVVRLYCVEGWDRNILWEGVLLKDIFDEVQLDPEANTVIFHAEDGYTTALPLDYILDNDIIMAYKQNNVALMPDNGFPFQLVAEDKYGIKWIKWITRIELSDDEEYKGFWEARGYSNEADVGGPVRGR